MTIYKIFGAVAISASVAMTAYAGNFELIRYGDFNSWLIRNIKESSLIGGDRRKCYAIAPDGVDNTGNAYTNRGGSPWGSSNVLASPAGVTKVSNAVYPDVHEGHGRCARLVCQYEHVKVLGMVNMDVIAGGTIFTGQMLEPIKSTKNPYSKMNMGIPFTRRPKALQFDYKVLIPAGGTRIYSSGFGKKKTIQGSDHAEAFVLLQRRWEDAEGNIYAKRVGTGREKYRASTSGWVNGHRMKIIYGQTGAPMDLIASSNSYYARNSKGKMVPVKEVGWDADGTPTHMIVMFSASGGEPYVGTPGLTLWVDNVGLWYE